MKEKEKILNEKLAALWYTGLIRLNLEYCAPLLFCTNSNDYIKNGVLKIGNRCLKIVNFANSKNVTRLRNNIYVITSRYLYLYLSNFFKPINKLVPIIYQSLLPEKLSSETRLSKSEGLRLSKDSFRFSIANFCAKLFNDLPPSIKQCRDLDSFKSATINHIPTFK
mgnify:CR=1 FL=1